MVALKCLASFIFLSVIFAEPVQFRACPGNALPCTIHSVSIEPCREAASNQPCKIKRGRSAQISFNYTPDFESSTAESRAYWASDIDLPLVDMDTNACNFTPCPIAKNTQHVYNQSLPISRKFPSGTYDIKWRMTSGDNECCFLTAIKLVR